jgi:hypothetical protein
LGVPSNKHTDAHKAANTGVCAGPGSGGTLCCSKNASGGSRTSRSSPDRRSRSVKYVNRGGNLEDSKLPSSPQMEFHRKILRTSVATAASGVSGYTTRDTVDSPASCNKDCTRGHPHAGSPQPRKPRARVRHLRLGGVEEGGGVGGCSSRSRAPPSTLQAPQCTGRRGGAGGQWGVGPPGCGIPAGPGTTCGVRLLAPACSWPAGRRPARPARSVRGPS